MQERLLVGTSLAFGGLGLLVAAFGLFGLLSYFVTSRKTEIVIRMALGAGRSQISWLFIREVAIWLALGCVIFVVTLLSVLVPLRWATSIDPLKALRTE